MDSIRKKYATLFGFNEELRQIVESVLAHHPHPDSLRAGYALFALGKAYKTHAAALLLCEQGYGEDATILVRSILELAVYAAYIGRDSTDATAQKYFDFDWVERERKYNTGMANEDMKKEFEKRIAADPQVKDKLDEIVREATRVKAGYTKDELRKGWSGKTIRAMAEEVGRLETYQTVYNLQSDLAHSGMSATNEYIREEEGVFSMDVSPSENWVERTLVVSVDVFLGVIHVWNEVFGLGLDAKLNDFETRYVEAMKAIRSDKNGDF